MTIRSIKSMKTGPAAALLAACLSTSVVAQTITVVGTRHLSGMQPPPAGAQLAHTVDALSAFKPTQVCVERMSGTRIEMQLADPAQHGTTFLPETHGRPLASVIVPVGIELQMKLKRRPADARQEAAELLSAEVLATADRVRAIAMLLAGYEFHSAVLNWSYLDETQRGEAEGVLGPNAVRALEESLDSVHEVYSLGIPLARKAGLRKLCTADSLEFETRGMDTAREYGGEAVLANPLAQARMNQLVERWEAAWQPDAGPQALTTMLRFFNSDEYAELDRRLQWETLRKFDNEAGAFHRRLMYWHARTAEISAELFRALAQGPKERVMLIIGSSHRPFTEADLKAYPWVEVKPASLLLEAR